MSLSALATRCRQFDMNVAQVFADWRTSISSDQLCHWLNGYWLMQKSLLEQCVCWHVFRRSPVRFQNEKFTGNKCLKWLSSAFCPQFSLTGVCLPGVRLVSWAGGGWGVWVCVQEGWSHTVQTGVLDIPTATSIQKSVWGDGRAAAAWPHLCVFCFNGGSGTEPRDDDWGGLQQQHPERRAGGEEAAGAGPETGAAEWAAADPGERLLRRPACAASASGFRGIVPVQPAAQPAVPVVLGVIHAPGGAFRLFPPAHRRGWSVCCGGAGGQVRAVGSGWAGSFGLEFSVLLRGVWWNMVNTQCLFQSFSHV